MTAEDADGLIASLTAFVNAHLEHREARLRVRDIGGLTAERIERDARHARDVYRDQLVTTLVESIPGMHGAGR